VTCFYGCVNNCAVHPDNTNATTNSIIFDDRNSVVVEFFGLWCFLPLVDKSLVAQRCDLFDYLVSTPIYRKATRNVHVLVMRKYITWMSVVDNLTQDKDIL